MTSSQRSSSLAKDSSTSWNGSPSTSSSFHELVLLDSRENAFTRFQPRAADPGLSTHHREAVAMIKGDAHLGRMYDDLVALLEQRPRAIVVRTTAGDLEGAYRNVLPAVESDL